MKSQMSTNFLTGKNFTFPDQFHAEDRAGFPTARLVLKISNFLICTTDTKFHEPLQVS